MRTLNVKTWMGDENNQTMNSKLTGSKYVSKRRVHNERALTSTAKTYFNKIYIYRSFSITKYAQRFFLYLRSKCFFLLWIIVLISICLSDENNNYKLIRLKKMFVEKILNKNRIKCKWKIVKKRIIWKLMTLDEWQLATDNNTSSFHTHNILVCLSSIYLHCVQHDTVIVIVSKMKHIFQTIAKMQSVAHSNPI